MSFDPQLPPSGEFDEWSRVDPRTVVPLVAPVIGLAAVIGGRRVITAPSEVESVMNVFVEDWTGLIVLTLFALSRVVAYFTGRLRLADNAVQWRSGLVFRQSKDMAFERVQDVSSTRPLLARALGLTQVTVSSAGSDGEIHLRYLSVERAERFTAVLMRHVAGHGATAVPSTPPTFDPSAVIDASVLDPTSPDAHAVVRSAGPTRVLHTVDTRELMWSLWNSLWALVPLTAVAIVAAVYFGVWGIVGVPVVIVGLAVWGVVGQTLGRYNLSVELDERSVRATSGLTTVKRTSNQLPRVQVIAATSTWMQRRRGTEIIRYASADATIDVESGHGENLLALDVAQGTWAGFAEEVFGRPVMREHRDAASLQRRPAAAIAASAIRSGIVAAVIATLATVGWVLAPSVLDSADAERSAGLLVAVLAGSVAFALYGAFRSWRLRSVSGWAIDDDDVLVASGLLHRRSLVAPRVKVQSVTMTSGPLQRRLGLASVLINLAPVEQPLSPTVVDIALDDARLLMEALAASACEPLPAGV